jgi:hypothetical protein
MRQELAIFSAFCRQTALCNNTPDKKHHLVRQFFILADSYTGGSGFALLQAKRKQKSKPADSCF